MSTYIVPNIIATNSFFKSEEYLSPNSAIGEGIVGAIGIGIGTAIVDKAIGAVIVVDAIPGPANPGWFYVLSFLYDDRREVIRVIRKVYYKPEIISAEKKEGYYIATSATYAEAGIIGVIGGAVASGVSNVIHNPDKVAAAIVAVDAVPGPANPG